MPFVIIFIAIIMVMVAIQGTYKQFGALLQSEFTGSGNFGYWVVSLGVVGMLGYIPTLQNFSRMFIALIILVLFLTKGNPQLSGGGFFQQFNNALKGSSS